MAESESVEQIVGRFTADVAASMEAGGVYANLARMGVYVVDDSMLGTLALEAYEAGRSAS